jgi:hypothetical protein
MSWNMAHQVLKTKEKGYTHTTTNGYKTFFKFCLIVLLQRTDQKTEPDGPMLTFKTEVNGDSKNPNARGSFLGLFVGIIVPVQYIFVLQILL